MNVSAALDWLFSTQFFGIKLGLDNTRKLLAAAGADRINATVVHDGAQHRIYPSV